MKPLSDAKRVLLERRLQGSGSLKGRATEIPRRGTSGPVPLSFGQEQLWTVFQLTRPSHVYNEPVIITRTGSLNPDALERSLNELARRHEAWRTSFAVVDGEPVQVIDPPTSFRLPVVDLCTLPEDKREAEAIRLVAEDVRSPFDLEQGPLWRAMLLHLGDERHWLCLTLRHILFDGITLYQVLLPDLVALYQAEVEGRPSLLPELPIQYPDFALWQREATESGLWADQVAYWREQLKHLPALALPTDRPRPPKQSFRGAMHPFAISRELVEALRTVGRREGVSLFTTALAAFFVLLHRYSGQEDLVVGTVSSGRKRPELVPLLGYFLNPVVLRGNVGGNPTFLQLLARAREVVLDALANDDVPFQHLVSELHWKRDPSRNPLFQVSLTLEPSLPKLEPGWSLDVMNVDTGTSKFDISLELDERSEGIIGRFVYSTDLFDADTIARMARHMQQLLEAIVADPTRQIAQLPMLGAGERHQLLVEWNATDVEHPRQATIGALFDAQVEQRPDAVALVFRDQRLSYSELNARANQLAHHLCSLGVGREVPVGICIERSLEMVIGLLGILKAGGAYVPLDPDYPADRLRLMLEDTQPPVILTTQGVQDRLPAAGALLVRLDADWPAIAAHEVSAPVAQARPDTLAYVMYTSGSTGMPRGVMIEHRSVVRLVWPATYAQLDPDQVLVQLSTLSFDASTFEIWGALLNGGRLVVAPPGILSAAALGELVEREGVTTLWLTAGLFNQLVDAGLHHLSGVHQLLTGGEPLSPSHCARALEVLTATRLINGYGPTEGTTFTCCHLIQRGSRLEPSVPIGKPIGGTRVYVLDRHVQPVPVGVPGELFIGGLGVARGYLNNQELTEERFVPDPFGELGSRLYRTGDIVRYLPDGTFEFLGRVDRQLKIRGYRVEPGELEAILSRHPGLREVAVEPWEPQPGDRRLVAYMVSADGNAPGAAELSAFLRERVPGFMVPSLFIPLERLPLTANGKVDRRALPAPEADPPEQEEGYVAPRTQEEEVIARIWRRVLRVERVGVHDDFFDLGGHSLLAVRMLAEVELELACKATVASIFESGGTVAGLAALLETGQPREAGDITVVVAQPAGNRPTLFFLAPGERDLVALRYFVSALGPDQPVVGLVTPLREDRRFDLEGSVDALAQRLLASILERQPHGPYCLCGHSLAGLVAYEIARKLRSQGEEVAWLGLLDTLTPNAVRAATRRHRQLRPRLQNFAERIQVRGLRGVPAELWGVVLRRIEWVRASAGLPLPAEQFDYLGASVLAMKHRVASHDLPLDLFVTSFGIRMAGDPVLGWEDVHQGPLRCHRFSGPHGSLLKAPNVTRVVDTLAGRLRECAGG